MDKIYTIDLSDFSFNQRDVKNLDDAYLDFRQIWDKKRYDELKSIVDKMYADVLGFIKENCNKSFDSKKDTVAFIERDEILTIRHKLEEASLFLKVFENEN